MSGPTKSDLDVAKGLRELSDSMLAAATNLTHHGGMRANWQAHSKSLIEASAIVQAWAVGIEKEA